MFAAETIWADRNNSGQTRVGNAMIGLFDHCRPNRT